MQDLLRASALILVLSITVTTAIGASDQPFIGEAAPEFSLSSLNGETVSSADFAGKLIQLQAHLDELLAEE